jgi:hypothetical protein
LSPHRYAVTASPSSKMRREPSGEKLSESTGGRVFAVSRTMSLREIYEQIGQDLRLQYELGYKSSPGTQPNSYH